MDHYICRSDEEQTGKVHSSQFIASTLDIKIQILNRNVAILGSNMTDLKHFNKNPRPRDKNSTVWERNFKDIFMEENFLHINMFNPI